jgi:hypothetical protein
MVHKINIYLLDVEHDIAKQQSQIYFLFKVLHLQIELRIEALKSVIKRQYKLNDNSL